MSIFEKTTEELKHIESELSKGILAGPSESLEADMELTRVRAELLRREELTRVPNSDEEELQKIRKSATEKLREAEIEVEEARTIREAQDRAIQTLRDVDHPSHYGGNTTYETIKVLRAWNLEGTKWFCWGNAIKYLSRAGKKGSEIKDYEKAQWYTRELASIQKELDKKKTEEAIKAWSNTPTIRDEAYLGAKFTMDGPDVDPPSVMSYDSDGG